MGNRMLGKYSVQHVPDRGQDAAHLPDSLSHTAHDA